MFLAPPRLVSNTRGAVTAWKNLRRALPSRRAKAVAWAVVALPAGVIVLLASLWARDVISGFVPKVAFELSQEVLGQLALFAAIVTIYFLVRYGRRHVVPAVEVVQHQDQRAPILLLRSFKDDNSQIYRELSLSLGLFYTLLPKRLDEFLEESLRSYGPVIAIGRPQESLPQLGAAREYASETDWHSLVEKRLSEARLVVAVLGRTEGLAWEMSAIARLSAKDKLILVVPPFLRAGQVRERWKMIRGALDERFELPANTAMVSWQGSMVLAVTVRRLHRQVDGYRMALAWLLRARSEVSPERSTSP